jgi:hypothetical protein
VLQRDSTGAIALLSQLVGLFYVRLVRPEKVPADLTAEELREVVE